MKKGKERTGQLVARYGLLVALGLGSTSFVSAGTAWTPQGKSVKYVNPGKAAGKNEGEGQAFEYQRVDASGLVPSPKLSADAISGWFKGSDTSAEAQGLVDKAINGFIASKGPEGLKEVFTQVSAQATEPGVAEIKNSADALKDKDDFSEEKGNISAFFALVRDKGNENWQKLASDGLFAYLKKDDFLTEPAKGVFSLGKTPNECAIFEAADRGSKLDFSKDGIPTVKFMDKDAPILVEHIAFDKGADLTNCFVKDAPIANDNDALKAVRSAGENGNVGKAITAMEKDINRTAAILYTHEILGKDGVEMPGAIERVMDGLNTDQDKYIVAGGDNLSLEEIQKVTGVFSALIQKSKSMALEEHHFTDYSKVEAILKAAQEEGADFQSKYSDLAHSGLCIEKDALADLSNSGLTNFSEAIQTASGSSMDPAQVRTLAKLIHDQVEKIPTTPYTADENGDYPDERIYQGFGEKKYQSIYQLVGEGNNSSLVKALADCMVVVKDDQKLDTYSAQKLVSDIQTASNVLLGESGHDNSLLDEAGIAKPEPNAAYLASATTELADLTKAIADCRGKGGLFAITLPDDITGKSFTVVNRHVFADEKPEDGNTANPFTDQGEVDLAAADKIVDLSNDYRSGETATEGDTTKGNGITIFTPNHENASVVRVLEAISGNVDDKGVRHAYSKNVKLGDIITGATGDDGSTTVVLVNHLANNQPVGDEGVQDKEQRFVVVHGAIKESAVKDANWATKDNKIDLVISADTLKNVTRFDKPVNVRTITLGTKAGQVFQDSEDGTIAYSSTDEGAGQVLFLGNVKADQMIAQSGVSTVALEPSVQKFYVREVLADGEETGLQLALGNDYKLNPTSDKVHMLGAQNGATFAEKCEAIELETYASDDKARMYTYILEGNGSRLELNSTQISMGAIDESVIELNGVKIADSTPDKLPGVIEVKPGSETAVCTLNLEAYANPKDDQVFAPTQISLESNKGLNVLRVDGPGKLQILGDKSADLDVNILAFADGTDAEGNAYPESAGLEKGNGFGYAIHAADATVNLVSGQLPVKGNTLINTLDIAKDAVWGHVAGSLDLTDLKVAKGGTLFSKSGDVTIENVVDGSGALGLARGMVSIKKDLTLNDNDAWLLENMDAAFGGNVAATKSKASFENSEDKKVDFKGDFSLSDGSDWRFKGGEVAVAGKAALNNSAIAFDGSKTTFADDFEVTDQSVVNLSNGSLTVAGDLTLNNNKELTLKDVDTAFEKAVTATKGKASFENAEGKKVAFKGDLNLSDESDFQFKGGEVAFEGKTALKNSRLTCSNCKTTIAGNLEVREHTKVSLLGGSITVSENLILNDNEEWTSKDVDSTFEKGVAAIKSKALFENAEDKKVDFKGGVCLNNKCDWQFKGGEVAFAGQPLLWNSKIAFEGSKTTIAGDLVIGGQDNISVSGGSLTVQGNLSLMESATFSGDVAVKDFTIKNGATFTKTGGDLVIGGNAHIAGQIDASQDAEGKIKFTGNDYTVTFEPVPVSADGKQILTTIVRVAAKNSIEGLDKARGFLLNDLAYVEEFGVDQLLEVYKNNPKIVLFDNIPDEQSDGILAKLDLDRYSVIPGLSAERGSLVVNAQNASEPDDLRILSKIKGEEYVKGLPSILLSSLAQPYRVGRRNAGSTPEFVPNEDGSGVTVKGTVTGKGLLDGALAGYAEADISHAGKRLEAITRSTAEENARAAIQIANSARATAYNNLDKLMDPAAHYSIWASGFGDIARQKVSGYKVNYDIYGFEAGLDTALNNYWTLGILGGYGKATGKFKGEYRVAKIDSYLDKCDTKSYFGGVYGMWSDYVQDLEVKFSLLAGHLKFDEKRNIKSPLTGKSVTDFGAKGWWISGNVDATYKHWDVAGIKLGPWAAFSFTDVHQKESANPIFGKDEVKINDGKGLVSKVSEKYNRYAPELTIGVAADYDSPFGLINLAAGYKRDFHKLSGGASYLHSQVIGADGKVVGDSHKLDLGKETHQAGKNSFVAQASYNMEYGPVGLSLGLRGQIGNHFKDVAGSVTISYSF